MELNDHSRDLSQHVLRVYPLYHVCEIPKAKWPQEVVDLGGVVGGITAEAAQHLGLPEGLPVAQGGADAFVGMGEIILR